MSKLTIINGMLRHDGAALVLSSDSEPCCCCPTPPNPLCVNIFVNDFTTTLHVSGTYYALLSGGSLTKPTSSSIASAFPVCIKDKYTVTGVVKAGGYLDDYGSVADVAYDDHVPCFTSRPSRVSVYHQDSAPFDLDFVAFDDDPDYCYIPISYEATSSNCGAPTGVNITVCLTFTEK
jgi:hypothetical protein